MNRGFSEALKFQTLFLISHSPFRDKLKVPGNVTKSSAKLFSTEGIRRILLCGLKMITIAFPKSKKICKCGLYRLRHDFISSLSS